MIGFGELRRLSLQWHTGLDAVERTYALDWLLKGIYDREILAQALTLRGAAALNKAYFADYPLVEDLDLARDGRLGDTELRQELEISAQEAAAISRMNFILHSLTGSEARFEFTGPLGRRSAAQPLIPMRVPVLPLRLEAVARPLLHHFSDRCETTVRALALEELAAERIAGIGQKPRARDVFDLWFILSHSPEELDRVVTRGLAERIAAEKKMPLRNAFDPAYRPLLERAWDNALKHVGTRPAFAGAAAQIESWLAEIFD